MHPEHRVIQSQADAKRFFADKVTQQAAAEAVALTQAERTMLLWSESDPEFTADPVLAEELAAQMSDEQYEAKISGLLARRFATDVAANSQAVDVWRQAKTVLDQGDHYISIILERAVGSRMKPWWQFWR
jgi:hypothetical protein